MSIAEDYLTEREFITLVLDSVLAPEEEGDQNMDMTERIIAWENDELDFHETCELFQELVDSGLAWQLQGSYGRFADNLIRSGFIRDARRELAEEAL